MTDTNTQLENHAFAVGWQEFIDLTLKNVTSSVACDCPLLRYLEFFTTEQLLEMKYGLAALTSFINLSRALVDEDFVHEDAFRMLVHVERVLHARQNDPLNDEIIKEL